MPVVEDVVVEPAQFDVDPIEWSPVSESIDQAVVTVPIDYSEPQGQTIDLVVARHRATDPDARIGSLLVNPGGPGFGGTRLVLGAEQMYDEQLLAHFDIVGWDPRGTGLSEMPIVCINDYDPYFALPPLVPPDAGVRADVMAGWQDLSDMCVAANSTMWEFVGTNNTARDMDVIRRALGEETISYFGFSYGSTLGATWATLFPETVRAAVLDGAANPDPGLAALERAAGLEMALGNFLAWCSSDAGCAFHSDGHAADAFDELMVDLAMSPVPTSVGRAPANRMMTRWAIEQAMYDDASWPELGEALAAARDGDGNGILALYDALTQRAADGTYGHELEALWAINCADISPRQSVDDVERQIEAFSAVAPRMFPDGAFAEFYCSYLPEPIDPRVEITGVGAGDILVIGITGDGFTPLVSSEAMANQLESGHLLIVEANQHTGYSASQCARDAVNSYLVDGQVPRAGTRC